MNSGLKPIVWSSDMAVGHARIDAEHQALVTLYNDLVHALGRPVSAITKRRFLETNRAHLQHHLAHEEAVLKACGYSQADEHARGHQEGEAAFTALFERPNEHLDLVATATLLRTWIVEHILVEDRAAFATAGFLGGRDVGAGNGG